MNLRKMYPPQKDSPSTFIQGNISATDIYIVVGNSDMLPQEVPYPLTLGIDKTLTETVIVTEIGQRNNQLTVTRQQGSLAWLAGTKVARVFNAADLLTLQQNVTDVANQSNTNQDNIVANNNAIATLEETVGDKTGGLVKELADETARAIDAETAETNRAMASEAAINAAKPDRTELPQVITDWEPLADGTEMLVTLTRYNVNTKTTSTYTRVIPLVSDNSVGLMTPEAYGEIGSLRNDVNVLQQQGGRFIGVSFATKADLDAYIIPSTVKIGDFTYVLDDNTHEYATTRYIYDGVSFNFAYVINYDPIRIATSDVAGIVKSDAGSTDGKIFVELDGTMSVVGWNALKERVETIETDLSINKVIELMQSLRTSQSLIESLEDSSMEEILDSDGNSLKAQIRLQII